MKTILFLISIIIAFSSKAQNFPIEVKRKDVKVISEDSTDYYYVYRLSDLEGNNTGTYLSAKDDSRFLTIKLVVNNCYNISYGTFNSYKVEDNLFIRNRFPGRYCLNFVKISDSGAYPSIVLKERLLKACKN